jgi:hypothetical protein
MKRRHFIKGVGYSSAALATTRVYGLKELSEQGTLPAYAYGKPENFSDVISREGLVVIRLAYEKSPGTEELRLSEWINVKKARINRMKSFPFDAGKEVHVLWLQDASPDSVVLPGKPESFHFTLEELLEKEEITASQEGLEIKVNFLLDRELGEISLEDLGVQDRGDKFSFVAMADPQGGFPDDREKLQTRMKIHNAFIEESVDLVNRLEFDPLFTVVAGDVCDEWGYEKDLAQMNTFLSRLKCPVLYGIGNHETLLRSGFGPGYNMEAFHNFLAAQKAMNGLEKLLYSFEAGQWHFVVWPDPLRNDFWETHPHYFDWLERDLEKNKERPTMVFQHVPIHPVGITPHINYAESVYVRRTFLDILSRQGNVKYILSGHVHIPVKASFKTAVSLRGIKLINLPAAGYRPRSFGEADFYGGPSQGVALIHIQGEEASIQFKTVTEEVFKYPSQLPEFDEVSHPLWLKEKWELPAASQFVNGDFQEGLSGWALRFVYTEDVHPSNLREVREAPELEGKALYLYGRRRGYQAPGQDRLPQDINRLSQALQIEPGGSPLLRFIYRIDRENTNPDAYAGGYVLVEGFSGKRMVHKLMYSAGKIWVNNWGARNPNRELSVFHYHLPASPDRWQEASLNVGKDFELSVPGISYGELEVDRLVLTLGVWNINDGETHPFGMYFSGFKLEAGSSLPSTVNDLPVEIKAEEDIWWLNKTWPWKNASGEHRYILSTQKK